MTLKRNKAKIADLTAELKAFGLKVGAETIGVAPVERYAPAPIGFKPTDHLPGAKNVVAFIVPRKRMADLLEQMEILSNPEAMKAINKAKAGKGKYYPISVLDED